MMARYIMSFLIVSSTIAAMKKRAEACHAFSQYRLKQTSRFYQLKHFFFTEHESMEYEKKCLQLSSEKRNLTTLYKIVIISASMQNTTP